MTPAEPLSQVVFVEDYFQLVFQAEILSVFGSAVVARPGTEIQQGQAGFCDAVVQLIGQRAEVVASIEPFVPALSFEAGATLQVCSDGNAPEAFNFIGCGNVLVVENGV